MTMPGQVPRVTLKLATSLDGRIALADGRSQWITCSESRAEVHRLRAAHDCVLTGVGTVLADDPLMTARPPEGAPARQPLRAVLDTRLKTPPASRILGGPGAVLFHAHGDGERARALENAGAKCVRAGKDAADRVSLGEALALLADMGCACVMIEAGGEVAASALRAGMVDRIEWFRAPILIGASGRACIADLNPDSLAAAPAFRRAGLRDSGADIWESWERA